MMGGWGACVHEDPDEEIEWCGPTAGGVAGKPVGWPLTTAGMSLKSKLLRGREGVDRVISVLYNRLESVVEVEK
jgi:hypothetical protein